MRKVNEGQLLYIKECRLPSCGKSYSTVYPQKIYCTASHSTRFNWLKAKVESGKHFEEFKLNDEDKFTIKYLRERSKK